MDPTVPAGAARLLDFVRLIEVGTEERSGYDVIYGFNQRHLPKPVTQMSVDEVQAQQASWSSRFGSSATGAYQFMRATLGDLKRELGLRGGQIMEPNLQDRLAYHLLKRRGYEQFVAGSIDRTEFGKRLAQEWASFPVLTAVRGQHQQLARGQSYYAGDRLNKALVSPERLEAVIDEALMLARLPVTAPVPLPRPDPIITLPEEAPMPAPVGHNGGPPLNDGLSPIDQMNKPVQGAKGNLAAGGVGAALLVLASTAGWLPAAWTTSPDAMLALGIVVPWLGGLVGNFVGSYRAPDKRFQT